MGEWRFVGRDDELRWWRSILEAADRGVVLAGSAGVGKTRLAVECLSMSRELGDDERHASLRSWAAKTYQPTWDTQRGEFYFHFNLDEPFPRAQFNHMLMPGLVSTGAGQWSRIFRQPNTSKFTEPTVTGVDFPTVRPRQAYWDKEARALYVAITSCDRTRFGDPTCFQVDNLLPGARYLVSIDGQRLEPTVPKEGSITVETRVGSHTIVVQQLAP